MTPKATPEQIDAYLALFANNPYNAMVAIKEHVQRRSAVTSESISAPSHSETAIITAQSLTKTYKLGRQRIQALHDVSFTIYDGEFVALTGASGSGKSTLLQLIGGLDKPTSGEIIVNDTNLNHLPDAKLSTFRNKTIGFIFQFFYLQPFLRLSKNIEVPSMFAHTKRSIRRLHVKELIERVGLAQQAPQLPKQLSGGQIQRAAIARALMNNPKILLADEPTGNLDSTNSRAIIELFKQIRAEFGMTIVLVTHNPEIAALADREIQLKDGTLI